MFGKTMLIVLTIVVNINVAYCVTCTFVENSWGLYECLLLNQNIESDDDLNVIDGTHLDGFTDADVTYLRAENSNITNFPSLLIDHFGNATIVNLSGVRMKFFNSSITHCDNVHTIYLDGNEINTFSGGIFQNCANLEALFLSDNLVEEVLPGTFDSTPNLVFIVLMRNNLTSWSAHNLSKIQVLNLSDNHITAISSATFVGMPQLFLLDLSNNSLTEIPTLEGLNQLYSFNLRYNKVKHVQAESFRNLLSLNQLYLSYNEIETLNFTSRSANILPNMNELYLDVNQLETIENFILPVNLTFISFAYNKLSHLETNSIEPISQLRFLNVQNNEIRRIDRDFFDNVTELTLFMRDNYCFSDTFTIGSKDEFYEKQSLLQRCFNSSTNLISSVFVLVAAVFSSVIFKL